MNLMRFGTKKGDVEFLEIDGSLENLQQLVDGYIEPCAPAQLREMNIELLANEEGLLKGLAPNENLWPFFFVGQLVAVGVKGEDFVSLNQDQCLFLYGWLLGLSS